MSAALTPTPLASIVWRAQVWRVIDGDTVDVVIDGPFGPDVVRVRLAGVQAPELHAADSAVQERAIAARMFLGARLGLDTPILVTHARPDKYGRRNARLWRSRDGAWSDVSLELLAAGHARPYDGHGRAGDS